MNTNHSGIQIDFQGKVQRFDFSEIDNQVQNPKGEVAVQWIHHSVQDAEASTDWLIQTFGFHPIAVHDAVSLQERPEFKHFDDHVFMVAPLVIRSKDAKKFEESLFGEVAIFIREDLIVSVSTQSDGCITDLMGFLLNKKSTIYPEVGFVLYSILDAVLDEYFPLLDEIEDRIEVLSSELISGEPSDFQEFLTLKKCLLEFRRRVGPFRDVINVIFRLESEMFSPRVAPYMRDLYDHSLRITEWIELNRESITGLLDLQLTLVSNRLNEVMKKMTIISTVLMSMALIAGIYGMNFKFMPELEWKYGYAFGLFLMALSAFGFLYWFRRIKWL